MPDLFQYKCCNHVRAFLLFAFWKTTFVEIFTENDRGSPIYMHIVLRSREQLINHVSTAWLRHCLNITSLKKIYFKQWLSQKLYYNYSEFFITTNFQHPVPFGVDSNTKVDKRKV